MKIDRIMWRGNPPRTPQEAAFRRTIFLRMHRLPLRGWGCEGVQDTGSPLLSEYDLQQPLDTQCEACGTPIRFVCRIYHPQVPDEETGRPVELDIGGECTAEVTGQRDDVEMWQREARNRAARRQAWLTRSWKTSRAGNAYINADGRNVTVYPVAKPQPFFEGLPIKSPARSLTWTWRAIWRGSHEGPAMYGQECASEDAAKLAAFDWINPMPSYKPK